MSKHLQTPVQWQLGIVYMVKIHHHSIGLSKHYMTENNKLHTGTRKLKDVRSKSWPSRRHTGTELILVYIVFFLQKKCQKEPGETEMGSRSAFELRIWNCYGLLYVKNYEFHVIFEDLWNEDILKPVLLDRFWPKYKINV